jgi:ABC-type dipeptide/oligopeptide/nickel transport system permease component
MGRFLVKRLFHMLLVLLTVSAITFLLMHAVPGGPFDTEKRIPEAQKELIEEVYHLNDPLLKQYTDYISNVFIPKINAEPPDENSVMVDYLINFKLGNLWFKWMNFGPSYKSKSRSVTDIMKEQFPVSIQLGIMALLVSVVIGMPLGILSAIKHNTFIDYFSMTVAIIGVSIPVIVIGPILIRVFGISLKWLPPLGWGTRPPYVLGIFPQKLNWEYFQYLILPAFALGTGSSAIIARLTRASLLQVLGEDYIRTARAKGLKERAVIVRHALKNALIPVVTIFGPLFAAIITGSFVTENIFGIPGLGAYFVSSIGNRDYPVIMGTILLYVLVLVFSNLFVDITYAILDPRIRLK